MLGTYGGDSINEIRVYIEKKNRKEQCRERLEIRHSWFKLVNNFITSKSKVKFVV